MFTDFGGKREHVLERRGMFERPLAGALNDRTISKGIAERNAQLNHARACVAGCEDDLARGGEIGIAAGHVGDEGRLAFEVEGHESIVDCGGF